MDSSHTKPAYISPKFETEPTKYFEEKLLSALFDKLLHAVVGELQPAVDSYAEKVVEDRMEMLSLSRETSAASCLDTGRSRRSHIGSIDEDSIFSLGKMVRSPRYREYPDLSDEDEEEEDNLPPVSLPSIRAPYSAPPVRLHRHPVHPPLNRLPKIQYKHL